MKVACVLANGFEDSEFRQPYDALREAGHEVTIVGLEAGKELNGDKGRETAVVERSFADVRPDEFDALLIPGGLVVDRTGVDHTERGRGWRAHHPSVRPAGTKSTNVAALSR